MNCTIYTTQLWIGYHLVNMSWENELVCTINQLLSGLAYFSFIIYVLWFDFIFNMDN